MDSTNYKVDISISDIEKIIKKHRGGEEAVLGV